MCVCSASGFCSHRAPQLPRTGILTQLAKLAVYRRYYTARDFTHRGRVVSLETTIPATIRRDIAAHMIAHTCQHVTPDTGRAIAAAVLRSYAISRFFFMIA